MIRPINNKGPMPELYTKYTVILRKAITTRNRSSRIPKIMIRAVFLFRYNVTSPIFKALFTRKHAPQHHSVKKQYAANILYYSVFR